MVSDDRDALGSRGDDVLMRTLRVLLVTALSLGLSSGVAGAASFGPWGNWLHDDCEYAAAANLFVHEYPNLPLTTNQVLAAWNDGIGETYHSSFDYMETTGFDGRTATPRPVTTRASIIYAASHGGVWATVDSGQHAVAIVAANSKGVIVEDSTMPVRYFDTWSWWATHQAGTGEEYWWFKWNQT
jgi:hypothetical protein